MKNIYQQFQEFVKEMNELEERVRNSEKRIAKKLVKDLSIEDYFTMNIYFENVNVNGYIVKEIKTNELGMEKEIKEYTSSSINYKDIPLETINELRELIKLQNELKEYKKTYNNFSEYFNN